MAKEKKNVLGLLYRVLNVESNDLRYLDLRLSNITNPENISQCIEYDVVSGRGRGREYELIGNATRFDVKGGAEAVYDKFQNVFSAVAEEEPIKRLKFLASLEPTIIQAFVQYFGHDLFRGK